MTTDNLDALEAALQETIRHPGLALSGDCESVCAAARLRPHYWNNRVVMMRESQYHELRDSIAAVADALAALRAARAR